MDALLTLWVGRGVIMALGSSMSSFLATVFAIEHYWYILGV